MTMLYSTATYGEISYFEDGWPKYTWHTIAAALWYVKRAAERGIEHTIIPHPGYRQ